MKTIFTFTFDREKEVSKTVDSTNEKGEAIQITQKVKEKVPQQLFVRKPNRELYDKAEVYYGSVLAEGIKAGMISNIELAKRYANDGGVFSEEQKKLQTEATAKYMLAEAEMKKLGDSPEDTEKKKTLLEESAKCLQILRSAQLAQQTLFDKTAESRAINNTVVWWLLHLSYTENAKGEKEAFFGDKDLKDKFARYDAIVESENKEDNSILQRFLYLISAWFSNKDMNEAELKEAYQLYLEEEKKFTQ